MVSAEPNSGGSVSVTATIATLARELQEARGAIHEAEERGARWAIEEAYFGLKGLDPVELCALRRARGDK